MKKAFWYGKRVFLTGHTGFKGSWLSLWLGQLGAKVCGYALAPPTEPNLFTVADVERGLEHRLGDIRDLAAMKEAVSAFAPDVVIHMAAQPIVRTSYLEPVETYATNVMGTVHLLEAVRCTPGVRATVIVTSDKCYENRETIWPYRETDAMGGYDPYSSSKGCAELVTAAYARSFFTRDGEHGSVASVRAGNVIGGGDWAKDRLITDLMRGLMSETPIVIRNPNAVRPWQHVLEPLSGYLTVAERLFANGSGYYEAWNFGPDVEDRQTVEAVARKVCEHWGCPGALKIEGRTDAPHEAGLLVLDSTKARVGMGWRPRWSFGEGLARTVDWYRAYSRGADMRAFTLEQIEAFESAEK